MRNSFKIILIASIIAVTIIIVYNSVPSNSKKVQTANVAWVEVIPPFRFKNREAEDLSIKAFNLKKHEELDQAIQVYKQAIKIEPDNPKLYFDISECYARKRLFQIAIVNLNNAILLDSSYQGFYNNRGLLHYQLFEDEKAITDFEKAIQLENTIPDLYYNLSMAYYSTHRLIEACNAFEQAKKLGLNMDIVKNQEEYLSLSRSCK